MAARSRGKPWINAPMAKPPVTDSTSEIATLPSVSTMSALALPEASNFARRSAMSDGANSTRGLIAPVRHNSSSAAMKPPTTSRRIKPTRLMTASPAASSSAIPRAAPTTAVR